MYCFFHTSYQKSNWFHILLDANENPLKSSNQPIIGDHDFTLCSIHKSTVLSWEDSSSHNLIRNLFTTGHWGENEDARTLLEKDAKAREELKMNEAKKYAAASGSRVQHTYHGKQSFYDNDSDDFEGMENNSDNSGDDDDDDVNDSESNNDEDVYNQESDDENIFHDSNSEDENNPSNNKGIASKDLANLESEYDKVSVYMILFDE